MEQLNEEARLKEEELQKRKEGKDIRKMFTSKPKNTAKNGTKKKKSTRKATLMELDEEFPSDENAISKDKFKNYETITENVICEETAGQSEQLENGEEKEHKEDSEETTKPKKRRKKNRGLGFLKIKFVGNNDIAPTDEEKAHKVLPSKDIRHMFAKAKQDSEDLVKIKSPPIKHETTVFESLTHNNENEVKALLNDINSNIDIKLESNTEANSIPEANSNPERQEGKVNMEQDRPDKTNTFTCLKSNIKTDSKANLMDLSDSIKEDITKSSKRKRSNSNCGTVNTKKHKQCETKIESPIQRCSMRNRQKVEIKVKLNSEDDSNITETIVNNQDSTCTVKEADSITSPPETTTLRRSRRSKQKINYSEDGYNTAESKEKSAKVNSEPKDNFVLDDSVIEIKTVSSKEKNDQTGLRVVKKRVETSSIMSFSDDNKPTKPVIGKY